MFVGCSEISINVIVKHKQHVRITWPFCLPGGLVYFFSACWGGDGGDKKCFARGDHHPGCHYGLVKLNIF